MLRWFSVFVAVALPGLAGTGEVTPDETGHQPYPDAPPFAVQPRDYKLRFADCSRCHEEGDTDPEPRRLRTRHTREIDHGEGRMWCLTCHDSGNVNFLHTLNGERVNLDQAYIVCGSCHAGRQKDWYFGAHGKRVSGWQEERVILNCTSCHDPHAPAIEPRAPKPPPAVRVGLERQKHHPPETTQIWNR